MTVAIDKIDKIGEDGVIREMDKKGIDNSVAQKVLELLKIDTLSDLEIAFANSPEGLRGIEELKTFHSYLDTTDTHNEIKFDISLARGLSYYTGCIFEVVSDKVAIGSIGGGGRYDDLTGSFGLKGVSGVGVSFGAARIYDVMEELDLFPVSVQQKLKFLLIAFDEVSHTYAFTQLSKLRQAGISADLYPSPTKLKKQMKYANDIGVPHVILIGSDEVRTGKLSVKNMQTGDQIVLTLDEIISKALKDKLTEKPKTISKEKITVEVPVEIFKEGEVVKYLDFATFQKIIARMDAVQISGKIEEEPGESGEYVLRKEIKPAAIEMITPSFKNVSSKSISKSTKKKSFVKSDKGDDLTKIDGIGPAIAKLLNAAMIYTFKDLADTKVSRLQTILTKAGPKFKMHSPASWPEQSSLASVGRLDDLKKLQDELDGGR